MEMQTFGRRPVPERSGRLMRQDERDDGLTGTNFIRIGHRPNYELARGVPDRSHLGGDMGLRSVSASSGYGTREDSSSSEDIALRSLPGAVGWTGRPVDQEYPYNPRELLFERNGNYYSTVKPLITVVKPKPGVQVRARISLPPSPTGDEDDNYNISKQPEYGKLEVNLGDMLERLQSDLVGLRASLRGDMRDAEPLLTSSINAAKAAKPERTYEELEVTLVKGRAKSEYSKPGLPKATFRQKFLQELGSLGKNGFKTALQPDANPCVR